MIKEAYISSELTEQCIEKGYVGDIIYYGDKLSDVHFKKISISCAMRWLREVHNIYISIQPDFPSDKDYKMCWCCSVDILHEDCISTKWYQCYIETYEQACEAAILYCLKNLI